MDEKNSIINLGPRNAKARIAFDIVKRFHGENAAKVAEEAFDSTFSKGGVPEDIQEIKFSKGSESLVELLIKAGIVPSKTEWRRLVTAGAVRNENDEKITDVNFSPTETIILKIGKRRFVKIVL